MTNLGFHIAHRNAERSAFLKVLKADPEGAGGLSTGPESPDSLPTGTVVLVRGIRAAHLGEGRAGAAAFERASEEVNSLLERIDEAAWERKVQFKTGGGGVWEDSLSQMMWGFLFDAIHHRGSSRPTCAPWGAWFPRSTARPPTIPASENPVSSDEQMGI